MTYQIVREEGRGDVLKVYLDEMSPEAKARCGTDFNPSGEQNITLAKALCVGAMEMATRFQPLAAGRDNSRWPCAMRPLRDRARAGADVATSRLSLTRQGA
jgi:hypothetical protein